MAIGIDDGKWRVEIAKRNKEKRWKLKGKKGKEKLKNL